MALLAVQVHSNGQRQIRQVVVRSVGGRVKEVYEGDPEPLVLVVLTMARQPYNNKMPLHSCTAKYSSNNLTPGIHVSRIVRATRPMAESAYGGIALLEAFVPLASHHRRVGQRRLNPRVDIPRFEIDPLLLTPLVQPVPRLQEKESEV